MKVEAPIRIESTPNLREHWAARSKRAGKQKSAAYYALREARASHAVPCVVTLTRVASRMLDGDNLQAGFKSVRDGVALWLAVDDADARVEWRYAQKRGDPKQYGCEIEIT